MSIVIENIAKKKGNTKILKNINLEIKSGELIALVGPSGSGKTTLLRIIAGLDFPDQGKVLTNGINVITQKPKERSVGFVFQNYALFKHLTVFKNVAFGMEIMPRSIRPSKHLIAEKVNDLLESMHIHHLKNRYPSQLSGGQKQRVAIARALAISPTTLLLDEPFGALDARIRKSLRSWMRQLHSERQITTIFVTHDQEEAMEVADRIVIMNQGTIEQIDSPSNIYSQPANEFVYDFLGTFNVFEGIRDQNGNIHIMDLAEYKTNKPFSSHWFKSNVKNVVKFFHQTFNKETTDNQKADSYSVSHLVRIFARPYDMEITKNPIANQEYLVVIIVHIYHTSSTVKLELIRKNHSIIYAEINKTTFDNLAIAKGDEVFARPINITVFD